METMEITKIDVNPDEFGIEKKQAIEMVANLPQIIEERKVLEQQYSEVIKMDIEDLETTKRARELRLLIRNNRTQGINAWHKTAKDYFLRGGQFVDAVKRRQVVINERMESNLEEIEKHAEIKEAERLKALQNERAAMLSAYVDDAQYRDLSGMDEDVWKAYFETKKKAWEDEQAAIKKAEEDRIAKEKAEAEERRRIAAENKRLKKEAEERERLAKIEAEKREKAERERVAKQESDRKAREDKERKEREAYEAKLTAEREERERIQKELEAMAEVARVAREAEEAKKQAELSKGDSDKVNDLIFDIEAIIKKYNFKSEKNIEMFENVSVKLEEAIQIIKKS